MRARLLLAVPALALGLLAAPALAQLPGMPKTPGAGLPAAPRETPGPATPSRPSGPTVHLGALLPITGPGAWFGKEMRQGLEMAIGELNRAGRPRVDAERAAAPPAETKEAAPPPHTKEAAPDGESKKAAADAAPARPPASQSAAPAAPPAPAVLEGVAPLGVTLELDVADVQPLDVKRATDEFTRLAALGVPAVFTASPGPTLAIQSLAAARDVLVIHQGWADGRLPAGSRTILQLRPPVEARVDALLRAAAGQQIRRLALLAAGDEFGKAVRSAVAARWRPQGGQLVFEESLSVDAPDLPSRFRRLTRLAPEAVVLGFRGTDGGDVAARLREAGYAGPLLLLDDDPGARLAGGAALEGAVVVTDGFVPEPGAPGQRFADAYKKRFGTAPSAYAARAFDAVLVLAEGLRGAAAEGRRSPGGARLRETLAATRTFASIAGGRLALGTDGVLAPPLTLFTIRAGALAFVQHLPPAGSP